VKAAVSAEDGPSSAANSADTLVLDLTMTEHATCDVPVTAM
jgi:hypothetical protein